jgi:uncharacterized membrane protein YoaK (UPF0700 family)
MRPEYRSVDLLLLTWTAGTLDAISYLQGHAFTANMTGNTVLLGLALAGAHRERAFPCGLAIAGFAAGVALAALVLVRLAHASSWDRDLRLGVALELPFLATVALLRVLNPGPESAAVTAALILCGACALGIQSVAVRRLKVRGVITTFITGTITVAVTRLLRPDESEEQERSAGSTWLLAAMLAAYVAAAASGAALNQWHGSVSGFVPLTAAAAVEIKSLIRSGPDNAPSRA